MKVHKVSIGLVRDPDKLKLNYDSKTSTTSETNTMNNYQIAQINIAQAIAEMDSKTMQGFVNRLDEINSLADAAEGFVWRLQTDQGDSTAVRVFDDSLLLVNFSVWESIEALKSFVYRTAHVELIQDREAWFNKIQAAHQTMWWIEQGQIPTVEEAKQKLEYFQAQGATEQAFSFAKPFPHP